MTVTQLSTRLQNAVLALGMSMLVFSCAQEEIFEAPEVSASTLETIAVTPRTTNGKIAGNARVISAVDVCGNAKTVRLMAGQSIPVGEVSAYNDDENLYITISIEGNYAKDWFIRKTHLYTGERDETEGIKNPAPGKFPYSNDVISANNTGVQEYTYTIPSESLKEWGEFDIALHADVVKVATDANGDIHFNENGMATVIQSEGAWGEGTRFSLKGNWAMFFSYSLQDCEVACDQSWFRIVTRSNNGEGIETFVFDLVSGTKNVGTATYKREKTGGTGQDPIYQIDVTFAITEAGYAFEEFGAIYNSAAIPSGITRDSFAGQLHTDPNGKKVSFTNITGDSYWLGLYAKISGSCK